LPALRDPRYVRVYGKPMFVVFAPHELPDPAAFIDHWRRLAAANELPGLYFVAITNDVKSPRYDPFDAITPLPPQDFLGTRPRNVLVNVRRLFQERYTGARLNRFVKNRFRRPQRFLYTDVVDEALRDLPVGPRFLPCVLPNWDNTPRSGVHGIVYHGATPERFGRYLEKALTRVRDRPPEERIVFIKAWNEWAEGNYLEPDRRFGTQWLDVLRAGVYGAPAPVNHT
jgi:hypothetical protein